MLRRGRAVMAADLFIAIEVAYVAFFTVVMLWHYGD